MSYDQLRAEYADVGIGELIWDLLQTVTRRVARTYRTDRFNNGEPWSDGSITVLALEVAEALLADGRSQLHYVFQAADEDTGNRLRSLESLLGTKVRHTLRQRQYKTPVDRLLVRVRAVIRRPPYSTLAVGNDVTVVMTSEPRPARQLTDAEIRRGAATIDSIPRISTRAGAQRESKIYNKAHLEEVVRRLVAAFEPIRLADIRKILEILLTAWVPTLLEPNEEDHASSSTPETELARTQMHDQIDTFVATLEPVHRLVLIGKSQRISDDELAALAGISRPTLIKRREAVYQRVEKDLLDGLPGSFHAEAMCELLHACGEMEAADE